MLTYLWTNLATVFTSLLLGYAIPVFEMFVTPILLPLALFYGANNFISNNPNSFRWALLVPYIALLIHAALNWYINYNADVVLGAILCVATLGVELLLSVIFSAIIIKNHTDAS